MQTTLPTVIVVGGGYAGVLAANRVCNRLRERARVVLITPDDFLTDRIRLHQAAVHGTDVRRPYMQLLAQGVERVAARVVQLDPEARRVAVHEAGSTCWLGYDALILALGSRSVHMAGGAAHAAALQDVPHALQLAAALPALAPGARVLVVGGGLTAIELAAEVAETYPQLQVELAACALGEGLDAPARELLRGELSALGVCVREGVRIARLEPAGALLEDGTRIEAAISVLAGGFEPVALPSTSPLAQTREGRVCVDEQLRVIAEATPHSPRRSLDSVFAAGDFAAPPAETVGSGLRSTRMGCVDAMPLGAHAADQVARLLTQRPLRPFHFDYVIQCISIGRKRGVVLFVDQDDRPTGRVLRGRTAALIKEAICRFVIGGLRVERLLAGLYAWPGQPRSGMLTRQLPASSSVSSDSTP